MPSLQVRELPEPMFQKLKAEAERQHRSLAQQAVVTLERGLGQAEDPRSRRRRVLDGIAGGPLIDADSLPDPAALIREDRGR